MKVMLVMTNYDKNYAGTLKSTIDYWFGSRDLAVFITGMPLISFDSIVSSRSAFIVQ